MITRLAAIDWIYVFAFFALSLLIGLFASRKSGKNAEEYFLSGRNMPWWLLGISMVATTFSLGTPNLVTSLVRENGVAANWTWWAFVFTGMMTVFIYAKLWRRSNLMTDIEFYEFRYSGKPAAVLRGFRALYLGLIFNVIVMGSASLAAVKFSEIVLGVEGWKGLLVASTITLIYSTLGGLKAVILTDFMQFIVAMGGSIWACVYIVNMEEIGGLSQLLQHEAVTSKLSLLPDFSNPGLWVPLFLIPLTVQWWASYYPGSEPGGGGYVAQRIFSAKDEKNAISATLLFNVAHFALRPWPWILIAFASMIVFPDLSDLSKAFPNLPADKLGQDAAYPAMLTFLPTGLFGIVVASLIAAYMSTMSTQLNLGASYLVKDFYQRFIRPNASDSHLVWMGRFFTVSTMFLGVGLGLLLTDADQVFNLLLLLGSGTGLIYIVRWFWWRINAYTEIIAMGASLIIAFYLTFLHDQTGFLPLESWEKTVICALITTLIWVGATYVTPATNRKILYDFYRRIQPGGPGWERIVRQAHQEGVSLKIIKKGWDVPRGILATIVASFTVLVVLFATSYWLYGQWIYAVGATGVSLVGVILIFKVLDIKSS